MIKRILRPFVPTFILTERKNKWRKRQIEEWQISGCPVPPPHIVKQVTIGYYCERYEIPVLVETGTFMGDMVEAQKKTFKQIISIELGIDLFENAKKRFANDKHVRIMQGDSGKILPVIVTELNEPAIFWLDGHYSDGITAKGDKDCPIFEELDAILIHSKHSHILLIDDARSFTGVGDYPTIDELTKYVKSKDERYQAEVLNDIIRYVI